ncbi:hypothetical protein DY000_02006361 [Brassica cretica]|uniref:Uncharacterized protein n=1 Tax=Brassica cretica TaxID=69181 RepID=A0ABQ7BY10_BRACR|nr:hypothetical protein DY000_02006361 [Brassica cretica]
MAALRGSTTMATTKEKTASSPQLSLSCVDKDSWTKEIRDNNLEAHPLSETPPQLSRVHPWRIPNSHTANHELIHSESRAHPLSKTTLQLSRAHPQWILSSPTSNPELINSLKQSNSVSNRGEENRRSVD